MLQVLFVCLLGVGILVGFVLFSSSKFLLSPFDSKEERKIASWHRTGSS